VYTGSRQAVYEVLFYYKSFFHLANTRIPQAVPEVYLYCSTPKNPVGAEWILMEYIMMQGCPLGDCFDNLTYPQRIRVGMDLALVMSSLPA
jgi:hypothetical protein